LAISLVTMPAPSLRTGTIESKFRRRINDGLD